MDFQDILSNKTLICYCWILIQRDCVTGQNIRYELYKMTEIHFWSGSRLELKQRGKQFILLHYLHSFKNYSLRASYRRGTWCDVCDDIPLVYQRRLVCKATSANRVGGGPAADIYTCSSPHRLTSQPAPGCAH